MFKEIYSDVCEHHARMKNYFYYREDKGNIDFKFLDQYLIFCY